MIYLHQFTANWISHGLVLQAFDCTSVRITEGGADLKRLLFLAHNLVPCRIHVRVGRGIEHLLVLDSLKDALLGIIDETHVSGPPK